MEEEDDEYPQLLYMPATQHRTAQIDKKDNYVMRVNAHKCGIMYHERMAPTLKRLGLYQISQLDDCRIDRSLITALVERWRSETNTFHFRTGEMTVTLEDVSILWGLSLQGEPISGVSDEEWSGLVEDCLGIDPAYPDGPPNTGPWVYQVKNRGKENEWVSYSGNQLRLAWLRQHFKILPENADDETLARHTRAYCLDLLGSVMFPDTSSDGVPAMFLQFFENLDNPPEYNWGCAVLAYLYRELTRGCLAGTETLAGPMLLLQMWSWTRLNVGRPELLYDHLPFGGDDLDSRNAYGVKWTTRHLYPENPHNGGSGHFRDQLEHIPDQGVSWRPYGEFYPLLPTRSRRDYDRWMIRMPLIFFWIVEFHYPDRVMRQYHMYQSLPPPPPEPWEIVKKLRSHKHLGGRGARWGVDWRRVHKSYIEVEPTIINENRAWDPTTLRDYMHWFHTRCMDTSWPQFSDAATLSRPLPPVEGNVNELAYQPHGHKYRRMVMRTMQTTAHGISWILTRGKKAVGKLVLQMCRDTMADLEQSHIYESMLMRARIPLNVDEIRVDDDVPTFIPSMPSAPQYQSGYEFFDLNTANDTRGYNPYMDLLMGASFVPTSTSQPGPSTTSIPGPTFTPSTFIPNPSMPRSYTFQPGPATTEVGPATAEVGPATAEVGPATAEVPATNGVGTANNGVGTATNGVGTATETGPSTSQQDARPVRKKKQTKKWYPSGRKKPKK